MGVKGASWVTGLTRLTKVDVDDVCDRLTKKENLLEKKKLARTDE